MTLLPPSLLEVLYLSEAPSDISLGVVRGLISFPFA
jgi:hypothetical protein